MDLDNTDDPRAAIENLPLGHIVMMQGKLARVVEIPERNDLVQQSPLNQALYKQSRVAKPLPKTIEFIPDDAE